MSSEQQLERGLQASVKIYTLAQTKLGELPDASTECTMTRKELVAVKKAAAAMNRALTALVRDSHDAENRLTLELHMLRGIMEREHTDREANRARVFELVRRYGGGGGGGGGGGDDAVLQASTSGSTNPLSAPSASAIAVDRALASLERVEQSVCDLSPVGRVNVHGAGLLSAKTKLDAATVPVPGGGKRPRLSGASA